MKNSLSFFAIISLVAFASPQPAGAQGWGAILDWIHELSGPRMFGPALSYYSAGEGIRFRGTGAYRFSVASDDRIEPEGSVTMFSIQPTVEIPITGGPFEVAIGGALHRFGGDADENFWHVSIPAYAQLRFDLGPRWRLRTGVGGHYWLKFDEDDFAPVRVGYTIVSMK